MCVQVHVHVCRLRVDVRCLPWWLSTFFTEAEPLDESQLNHLAGLPHDSLSLLPMCWDYRPPCLPSFYVNSRDPSSTSHTYASVRPSLGPKTTILNTNEEMVAIFLGFLYIRYCIKQISLVVRTGSALWYYNDSKGSWTLSQNREPWFRSHPYKG